MFGIPFLSKKSKKTEGYVFMLFVTDAKIYGFAFEEARPEHHSTLYLEVIDSYLKDLADKVELLIVNCEKDLGKDIYLQDTVLVVSSFFLSEAGSVKEDTRKIVTKVFKELDLTNLGYVTTAEFFSAQYGKKHPKWVFLEETSYDYKLYFFEHDAQVTTSSVARIQDEDELVSHIKDQSDGHHIVAWIQNSLTLPVHTTYIDPQDIIDYGVYLYAHASSGEPSTETPQKPLSETATTSEDTFAEPDLEPAEDTELEETPASLVALPVAPGFGESDDSFVETEHPIDTTTSSVVRMPSVFLATLQQKFVSIKERISERLPRMEFMQSWWIAVIGGVVIISISAFLYMAYVHAAHITLVTNKENFSTTISFTVGKGSNVSNTYNGSYSFEVQTSSSGEKVIGEKAKGDITLYNRTYETKSITAGTAFTDAKGTVFLLNDDVTIASASGVPVQDGKRPASVTAQSVGTEANIDKNTKLTTDDIPESEVYAVSSEDFSGGFKKVVVVFSDDDKKKLETLAKQSLLREIKTQFRKNHADSDILFEQTVSVKSATKDYSAKVGEEARTVTNTNKGTFSIQFTSDSALRTYVQKQKLKDKEFVKDTFILKTTKLDKGKDPTWTYTAIVSGKIQKFIDRTTIVNQLVGKTVSGARLVLNGQHTVTRFTIKTLPIQLPIMPFSASRITFQFAD